MNLNRTFSTILIFVSMLISLPSYGQIWEENFDSYANGTFNAPPKWTSYATDCDDPSINTPGESQWGVYDGQFTVNDIEGAPCCSGGIEGGGNDNGWLSEVIDLTGFCDVSISLDVSAIGDFECNDPGMPIFGCQGMTPPDNSHDQVLVEYSLDGGGWTQIGYVCGLGGGPMMVGGLNGTTLQIRFFASCKSNAETYYIDNIVVNGSPGPPPTFDPIGPICETDPPVVLPTASIEGITGLWDIGPELNPANQGGNIITITFSPSPSFCNEEVSLNVEILDEISPTPDPIGPFCVTDPAFPLQTVVIGYTGSWTGTGVMNDEFDPAVAGGGNFVIWFNPDPGQCAGSVGIPVEVNLDQDPSLGTVSLCDNDLPYDLTQLEDPLFPGGSWSGPGVSGNTFDPTGLIGTINLTFIPSTPCVNIASTDVTVDMAATPILSTATACETDGLIDLIPLQDPSYPLGDWSGPGVTGTSFNPSGLPGTNVITFTSSQACVEAVTTTITVNLEMTPSLGSATLCETEGVYDLTQIEDPLYPGGDWAGPNVSGGNMFDPSGLSGTIILNYLPAQNCVATASANIFIIPPGTPDLGDTTICESSGLYNLDLLVDPFFPEGDWAGVGVVGDEFDPNGLTGTFTLTFTPINACAFQTATFITVESAGTPNLDEAILCESDPPLDLTTLQDPNFPNGTWSGNGVSGTEFDPAGLSGNIALTFEPTGNCVTTTSTFVMVNIAGTPDLDTAALCETAGLFNLTNLADPNYPAGTWSGDGVTGNNFDPAGLSGNINLTFTPTAACVNIGNTFITVSETAQPGLSAASICQNNGLFDLNDLADPNFPTGTWSGPGVSGNEFDPANQSGSVEIIFTPTADCTQPDTTEIEVFAAPAFSNLDEECDPNTQEFTVSFDITGSNAPFTIDGNAVTGNAFTSTPFPSGTNYSFELDDAQGCGPVTISGSANCACATDAGDMDFTNSPLLLCEGMDISVVHDGENLDTDDNLIFVLHTNAGTTLGNVLATSTTTTISYPMSGIVLGQTYYVSAVAGNDDGSGGVDLTDPCLSVAQGIPVSFYELDALLGPGATICQTDCYDLEVTFTGVAPYNYTSVILIDFGNTEIRDTITGYNDNTATVTICPDDFGFQGGLLEVFIADLEDVNCSDPSSSQSQTITVEAEIIENFNSTLCAGESIVINGSIYDENTPNGTEVFTNGGSNGCDSTVNIALTFFAADTTFINEILCTGGSLIVNGETYNENNPNGIETVGAGAINGCDSIISVNLSFNDEVFENLEPTLCPGGSIIVNGETYDANNPSGQETFPNGSILGCDSTVLINLSFYAPASAVVSPELCAGGSITINGEIYDENNPSGIDTIPDASINGCDSIINVNVTFTDEVTFNFTPTICAGDSVIVNGTTYDEANPSGMETLLGGSVLGCDSVINISLGFYNEAASLVDNQFCTGGSVIVNGTTYDETMPDGIEIIIGGSVNGCDSTIIVDLEFSNEVVEEIDSTLCPGGSINVNGNTYNAAMPSGSEIIPNGSILGCDSIIDVQLGFFPANEVEFVETLCFGTSITINGTVYNENNADGEEILLNADVNGCDSIIEIDIDFYLPFEGSFNQQLCSGSSITINNTEYNENNPSGTEIIQGGSVTGCDSILFVDLTFTDEVVFAIQETLCSGDSLTINGIVYNENNPAGSETFPGGSINGCDSTVAVQLSFFPEATSTIEELLAQGGSITVNGTEYNQNNPSGTEILAGQSINGCDSIVFISLTFEQTEIEITLQGNSTTCEFGSDGSIVVESITGGQPPYTIALNGGNSTVVAIFPFVYDNLENGFYLLTVLDAVGTIQTQDIFLPFPDPPLFDLGDDQSIDLGESVTLVPELDFDPASFLWEPDSLLSCSDCEMPTATPINDIIYTLTITDLNGCTYSDDVAIFVQKARNVYGPNAFSPNNDAVNDEFTLFAGGQVKEIKSLLIFDRWGDLVFEQFEFPPNNLSVGWDGRFKGEMMNPGVYVWFAEVEFMDGQVGLYEGEVTLIR
ncbi:MAG: gliding motility-associated C-terminal domain-containing protein [Bacteroidota bacterium]